uniref:Uncharacterized protein n=1 Tax=virus sp. ctEfN2 TaxID=2825810 RepID=A0A8S5RM94_9VIRU|nr:MAG TPA: hypothetical protein [virus sp. ctEfN2]
MIAVLDIRKQFLFAKNARKSAKKRIYFCEVKQMIDLANKCVLVRTHEEYENILKAAKKQGYRWYGGKEAYPYPFEEQQIPDILKFYSNKELTRNASLAPGYELVEASDIDRTALADAFIESLKLLADTVESQMEEVK